MEANTLIVQTKRVQTDALKSALLENKICLLQGPKFCNKTTAVRSILEENNQQFKLFKKEDYKLKEEGGDLMNQLIESAEKEAFWILRNAEFIPQLQNFVERALSAENFPTLVFVSSYELTLEQELKEALQYSGALVNWFPYAFYELAQARGMGTMEQDLEKFLIYGSLPPLVDNVAFSSEEFCQNKLQEIVDEIIRTQLSAEERINKKENLMKVLKTLAFEMGEVVSYNDIAIRCDLDNETVGRYITLFEKAFILKMIPSYYGGHKYEMKKGMSVYFVDNGIRNALINNFNSMDWRHDATQLWRNWLLMEKLKWNNLLGKQNKMYTWRTHTKQNVDFLEMDGGKMVAYQTSWTKKKKIRFPAGFVKSYPSADMFNLNRSTYWSFLSKKK